MRYKYVCPKCKAEAWVNGGTACPETGAIDDDITEGRAVEWKGGIESCEHEDAECVDSEYDDDMFWDRNRSEFV